MGGPAFNVLGAPGKLPQLATVKTRKGTRIVRSLMDSGADESVAPPSAFGTPIVPSPASEAGLAYTGADGSLIPALGQTKVPFVDASGRKRGLHFQVANVTQPLVAMAQLVDTDHIVVLGKQGGVVFSLKDPSRTPLPRQGNGFYLDMEVPVSEEEDSGAEEEEPEEEQGQASFRRPE